MKFEETLRNQAYPPWRDKYVRYGQLKEQLKRMVKVLPGSGVASVTVTNAILNYPSPNPQQQQQTSGATTPVEFRRSHSFARIPSSASFANVTSTSATSSTASNAGTGTTGNNAPGFPGVPIGSNIDPAILAHPSDAASDVQMTEATFRGLFEQYSKEFFDMLDQDLDTINNHFKETMSGIHELERNIQHANTHLCNVTSAVSANKGDRTIGKQTPDLVSAEILAHREALRNLYEELNRRYDLIHEFAQLNYLAFVKILKKHDKQMKQYRLGPYLSKVNKQPFYTIIDRSVPYTQPTGPEFRLRAHAANGDVDAVQLELSTGAPADSADKFGSSPLHLAARHGYTDCVRVLIVARADVNRKDDYGTSVLHAAARTGHADVIQELISAGAKIDVVDERGNTPLMSACESRCVNAFKALFNAGAEISHANLEADTALMVAAGAGATETVKQLLEAGADQTQRNLKRETPLSRATTAGHIETVRALLVHAQRTGTFAPVDTLPEEDVKLPTSSIPLLSACVRGDKECLRLLLDALKEQRIRRDLARGRGHTLPDFAELDVRDLYGCTPLLRSAEYRHFECMKLLLEAGANPNLACAIGDANTPIITCAVAGFVDGVRVLIEHDADLDSAGAEESTALMWAADRGYDQIVELLLKAGASVTPRNMYGQTALIRACVWNNNKWQPHNTRTVKLILSAGADCNTQANNGSSALSIATIRGHSECCKILLEHNARVDVTDLDGCQPLARAAMWGHVDCMKLLLEYNAQADARDRDGRTSLMFAASGGHYEATEVLLRAGANDLLQGDDGCTAFDYAMELGQTAVRALLLRYRTEKETASAVEALTTAQAQSPEAVDADSENPEESLSSRDGAKSVTSPINSVISSNGSTNATGSNSGSYGSISALNIHAAIPAEELSADDPLAEARAKAQAAKIRAAQAIASLLRRSTADTSRLREAASKNHVSLIKNELERGEGRPGFIDASGNARPWTDLPDRFGSTAVLLAAKENAVESLKLLLTTAPPPDVNVRNAFGTTPLLAAASNGHTKCIEVLLVAGADLNARDTLGTNALILASTHGHVDAIEVLLQWNLSMSKLRQNQGSEGTTKVAVAVANSSQLKAVKEEEQNDASPGTMTPLSPQMSETISDLSDADEEIRRSVSEEGDTMTYYNLSECTSEKGLADTSITGLKSKTHRMSNEDPEEPSALENQHCDDDSNTHVVPEEEEEADLSSRLGQRPSAESPSHSPLLVPVKSSPKAEKQAPSVSDAQSIPSTPRYIPISPPQLDGLASNFVNGRNHAGLTPLIAAAMSNFSLCVGKLIAGGAIVDEQDAQGDTALTHAARAGHKRTVEVLVKVGRANPTGAQPRAVAVDSEGKFVVPTFKPSVSPPLVSAARGGHTKILSLLLEYGAPLELRDVYGGTALVRAGESGHLTCVKILLAAKADVDALGEGGCTALSLASHQGHAEVVKELISAKASLDMRGENGATALLFAADKGHASCVKLLLDAKAHPEVPNVHRHTPLIRTVYWTNNEWRNEAALQLLVEARANVNASGEHGNTALHVASFRGHVVALNMLLEAKADVDRTNNEGLTALSRAAAWGNLRSIVTLLDNGANPQLQDKLGRTALYHAAALGRLEAVQTLLQYNANPSVAAYNGETPYDVAVDKGHKQVAAHLAAIAKAESADRKRQSISIASPVVLVSSRVSKKGTSSAPGTPNSEPQNANIESIPTLADLHPPQLGVPPNQHQQQVMSSQVPVQAQAQAQTQVQSHAPHVHFAPQPVYQHTPMFTPGSQPGQVWTGQQGNLGQPILPSSTGNAGPIMVVPLPVGRSLRAPVSQGPNVQAGTSGTPSATGASIPQVTSPSGTHRTVVMQNHTRPHSLQNAISSTGASHMVLPAPSSIPVAPITVQSQIQSLLPLPNPKLTLSQLCNSLRADEALQGLNSQGFLTVSDLGALKGESDWALVVDKLRPRRVLQNWIETYSHVVPQLNAQD